MNISLFAATHMRYAGFLMVGVAALAVAQQVDLSAGRLDRGRLLRADSTPDGWYTTGRDFGKSHFSPLSQIDKNNVSRVGFAWQYETHTNRGLEATPIVIDSVMYTAGIEGRVYALDALNGRELWAFDPKIDGQISRKACCDNVNRGVAVWQGMVYVAALDGRLFALNAKDGSVQWQQDTIIDHARGYSSTGAPEIAGDSVVIGNGGGEFDGRGYVTAYDLKNGKLIWRFYTVPGDPKKPFEDPAMAAASKTWDANTPWELGLGAPVWDGMVYDPRLHLLYIATGNAAPWAQKARSPAGGDNLYTCSVLALDARNGHLKWFYQEVPGDQWDYDSTAPMILTELKIGGHKRQVLLHAPKDGFVYVLDRRSGKVISAANFVPVNWTTGLDPKTHRANVNKDLVDYRDGPKLVYPWGGGGHSWTPMAYSSQTGLLYIPVVEGSNVLFPSGQSPDHRWGLANTGTSSVAIGAFRMAPPSNPPPGLDATLAAARIEPDGSKRDIRAFLDAWDPVQQKRVWRVPLANLFDRSGVLATAGGLVVQGTVEGELRFYDAVSGALLRTLDVGSSIIAAPMTYSIDSQQYIAVMAGIGGGPLAFAPPPGSAADRYGNQGRILAFRLDGGATPIPAELPAAEPIPQPPPLEASAEQIGRGGRLFAQDCARCHLNSSAHGATPDLRRMSAGIHAAFNQIVLQGALRSKRMPQWNDVLSEEDAAAIHGYLISVAWDAFNTTHGQGSDKK